VQNALVLGTGVIKFSIRHRPYNSDISVRH
jgi:hypothetical protein